MNRTLLLLIILMISVLTKAQSRQDFKTNQTDTFYGKIVSDPYRMLEDTGNAKVKSWMKKESAKAEKFFTSMPAYKKIYSQVSKALNEGSIEEINSVQFWNDNYYVTKRYPGQQNYVLYKIDKKGNEQVFYDAQKSHPEIKSNNVMIIGFEFDENANKFLYGLVNGGNESEPKYGQVDMITGEKMYDTMYLNSTNSIIKYDPERKDAFYYSYFPNYKKGADPMHRLDSAEIKYHIIGTDSSTDFKVINFDTTVIKRSVNDYASFDIKSTSAFVTVAVKNKVSNEYRIYYVDKKELNGLNTKWKKLCDFSNRISSYYAFGNYLFMISQNNASNSKVIRVDLRTGNLSEAVELIGISKMLINDMKVTKNELLVVATDGPEGKIFSIAHGANNAKIINTPFKGYISLIWADDRKSNYIVSVDTWTNLREYFEYNDSSKSFTHSAIQRQLPKVKTDLEVKTVFVKSHDGVMVPMTIIYKKGLKLDGSHPIRIEGYGAYGYTSNPSYWPESYIYYNLGGINAIAHVRGGGIYGDEWRLAGSKETKPNTWKDFIACADYLVANKYATKKNLVGSGGSAGGILIGRSITERPDLFGAAIISVGALDMIRMENSPNGRGNIPEFGSVTTAEGFKALDEMSSYHHVKDGTRYPAVLLTHGINDNRVPVYHSLKMTARLQQATTSNNPILLKLNFDSGHGMQQSTNDIINEVVNSISFRCWAAGIKGFTNK